MKTPNQPCAYSADELKDWLEANGWQWALDWGYGLKAATIRKPMGTKQYGKRFESDKPSPPLALMLWSAMADAGLQSAFEADLKPDKWKTAARWVNFMATEDVGITYGYQFKPRKYARFGGWRAKGRAVRIGDEYPLTPCPHWRETLEERPSC